MKVSKNFRTEEVDCNCGCGNMLSESCIDKLQRLRTRCGFPFDISSAARCPDYNRRVGGSSRSDHTKYEAFDLVGLSSGQRNILLREIYTMQAETGKIDFWLIEIADRHVHISTAEKSHQRVIWGKSK